MSVALATAPAYKPKRKSRTSLFLKIAVSLAILSISIVFVGQYVFHYFLNYKPSAFHKFWPIRGWLLLHISGGMVALLTGPFQFWTGFRIRYARLHRWTGRVFLTAVVLGAIGSFRLAVAALYGWSFGFGLFVLGLVWLTTAGMAYYAILKRQFQIHKEWMVRTYIVTFAFVTFRVLNDYGPTHRLTPVSDRLTTITWACWVIPLMIAEVVFQLRRMRVAS